MDERARRIGENEALFREVNERVLDVNAAFGQVSGRFSIVCECGRSDCLVHVDVTPEEYAAVRADGAQFIVVEGHELEDVEDVVARTDRFAVVRKREGGPAELARGLS